MPVLEALISYAIFIAFLCIIIEIWGEGSDLLIHNLLPQLEPFFFPSKTVSYVAQVILELVILSDEIADDCPHNQCVNTYFSSVRRSVFDPLNLCELLEQLESPQWGL